MRKISSQTLRRLTNRFSIRESVTQPTQDYPIDIAGRRGHS
jgi:hypothetical protein